DSWLLKRDIECKLCEGFSEKFQVLVRDGRFYIILERHCSRIEKIIEDKFSTFKQLIQIKIVQEINETN
ncbi:class I adenylate-forming enzyme family protein, partial [Enterococcus faecalis]